ncbi:hypothetical protein [Amycolatopsis sp. NBC_01480]|uniref:hypothetical protein n=1 Tax=Amycolatopsis sp. NBC_01480 TaxID=2903562 RepID=UPI002E2AE1FA|nr:hypothetical protein [Amycolatopsis sp. NBC_01480]
MSASSMVCNSLLIGFATLALGCAGAGEASAAVAHPVRHASVTEACGYLGGGDYRHCDGGTGSSLLAGVSAAGAATSGGAHQAPEAAGNVRGLDVGVASEAQPRFVAAPDSKRIWSVSSTTGPLTQHQRTGHASRFALPAASANSSYVQILVSGARLRSSVPSGSVTGVAYPGMAAYVSCQIPNGGYTWGWTGVQHSDGSWSYGWMRSDLYRAYSPGDVNWC